MSRSRGSLKRPAGSGRSRALIGSALCYYRAINREEGNELGERSEGSKEFFCQKGFDFFYLNKILARISGFRDEIEFLR